jgi:uncharacterized membrane protein
MKKLLKLLSIIAAVGYPFVIFICLKKYNASPRVLVLVILSMAMVYFLSHSGDVKSKGIKGIKGIQFWGTMIGATLLALFTFITENTGLVKLYPISISLFLLLSFASTLFNPPTMIYRFALLQKKEIEQSPYREKIVQYCKRVTIIWCIFFLLNGGISLLTALYASDLQWTLYNGMISYFLIGFVMLIEFIIRKIQEKRWEHT